MVVIKAREHGSYLIEGEVIVVDWQGRPYPIDRHPVALCSCGQSSRRPFCDGSHRQAGAAPCNAAPDPPTAARD